MSNVNWNNVVSAVATDEGLLVTERGADGMVGASPRLLPSQKRASVPRYQLQDEALFPCADSAMRAYKAIVPPSMSTFIGFKACNDYAAWAMLTGNFAYESPFKLYRLEAKPGYASQWVQVPAPPKS